MGIPSYFSHIIKKYGAIIKLLKNKKHIHNLYFDSNSIIYDIMHNTCKNDMTIKQYELLLYEKICIKLEEYISVVNPSNTIFIAFDGVAPVAKLEQQRTRRYKSKFIKYIENNIKNLNPSEWDSASITPGTNFMNNLDKYITNHFQHNVSTELKQLKIIVSGSTHVGEGEHKIFSFIRQNKQYHSNTNTFIYGLDSDLIMLCLNHLTISKSIYLFRESPNFANSLNKDVASDVLCYLDINELSKALRYSLQNNVVNTTEASKYKINDYILISFILGNDFLPHCPSLNIRTNGITILLETYKNIIGDNKYLCDGKHIQWKNFKLFITELSKNETQYLLNEYTIRKRWESKHLKNNTIEEKLTKFSYLPTKNRSVEKMIDPYTIGWEQRYYKYLFKIDVPDNYIKQICCNYLEGLEWTLKYYTNGCVNYRWLYKYNYPPLLCDLVNYIPEFDTTMISVNKNPIDALTQLSYVLPHTSQYLLPTKLQNRLQLSSKFKNSKHYNFMWAYCKYFWESHVDMNHIDINELEEFVKETI